MKSGVVGHWLKKLLVFPDRFLSSSLRCLESDENDYRGCEIKVLWDFMLQRVDISRYKMKGCFSVAVVMRLRCLCLPITLYTK